MSQPVDKQGCLDSVASHPPYRRHDVVGEPVVRLVGAATTVVTVTAEVATAWQLAHLQWTPADPTHDRGRLDG